MALIKGLVTLVNYKKVGKATDPIGSFSIGDGDDRVYYSTGFNIPPNAPDGKRIEVGDKVQFAAEQNEKGYWAVKDLNTLKIKRGEGPPPATASTQKSKGGENWEARGKYWEDKDKFDKEVGLPLLNYKFSLANAKDIVLKMYELDLLKAPAKKSAAYDIIMESRFKVTDELFAKVCDKANVLEHGEAADPLVELTDLEDLDDFDDVVKDEEEDEWDD